MHQTDFMGVPSAQWGDLIKQQVTARSRNKWRNWALFISGVGVGVLAAALFVHI
ncbi:TPA: hypothetical protein ACP32N_005061 [Pseudomonas aeruginosa]